MDTTAQILLTKKQVTELLNISVATLNRWMKDEKIRYMKLGPMVRFEKDQLLEDLKSMDENQ
jgi:excisionase family DNA binding protein